jgi:hypothetical protein
MTTPRFGTDPKGGANFNFGEILKSTDHMNEILPWMRDLDKALEKIPALNWPHETTLVGVTPTQAAYDSVLGIWAVVGANGGAPEIQSSWDGITWTSRTPAAGTATTLPSIASDNAGTFVAGADDGTVRYSTDGINWSIGTTSMATSIISVFWDSVNSLFVVSGTGRESSTSADGITWNYNATAYPASFAGKTVKGGATNGTNLSVVTCQIHDKCATSPDGTTWTERTMPSSDSWGSVVYSVGDSKWFCEDESNVAASMAISTDGTTWTRLNPTTFPSGTGIIHLTSTGNVLVAAASSAGLGKRFAMWSDDAGVTWQISREIPQIPVHMAYGVDTNNGGQLLMLDPTTPAAYSSLVAHP